LGVCCAKPNRLLTLQSQFQMMPLSRILHLRGKSRGRVGSDGKQVSKDEESSDANALRPMSDEVSMSISEEHSTQS